MIVPRAPLYFRDEYLVRDPGFPELRAQQDWVSAMARHFCSAREERPGQRRVKALRLEA